ncbi:DUF5790 family protein [Halobium salinum]|uniref:DUF5790 family protein n=1 Tax=Halobium salinum TaxID=1364940 RepID=A0ABD5PC89_9EURY|nr:DUF5790 family protein [Halobium salinum]
MASQSTFNDDEELFGEAAAEMRADVEEHLDAAWAELPDGDDVWETSADNVLGVLNGLRSALDAGDAEEHLRQAKKWYTMGVRADAFEDASDLEAEIEEIEEVLDGLEEARESVGGLTSTLPALRGTLDEAGGDREAGNAEDEPEADADDDADDADDESEADADDDEEEDEEE